MSEKIRGEHLQRGAYVYVRQSTQYQVRNHLEGKEQQYALAERAKQLGFSKVIVIDEDLGRSGSGAQERRGFGRLLASHCRQGSLLGFTEQWKNPSDSKESVLRRCICVRQDGAANRH
jgi:Resolvase, N terminal domain